MTLIVEKVSVGSPIDTVLSNLTKSDGAGNAAGWAETVKSNYVRQRRPYPYPTGDGKRILLKRIEGVTKKGLLEVPFLFQVPPMESMKRTATFSFQDYDTISEGQYTRQQGRQLQQLTFQSMFIDGGPIGDWPDLVTILRSTPFNGAVWMPDAVALAAEMIEIVNAGTPFSLYVYDAIPNRYDVEWSPAKGSAAILKQLDVEEKAGEPETRYVNVTFNEYRTPELARRTSDSGRHFPTSVTIYAVPNGVNDHARWSAPGKHVPTVLVKRMTLSYLSKFFYGHTHGWRWIAKANGLTKLTANWVLPLYVHIRHKKSLKLKIPAPPSPPRRKSKAPPKRSTPRSVN